MRVPSRVDAFRTLTKIRTEKASGKNHIEGLAVKAMIFSSPSIREDLNVEEATKQLSSSEHARTAKIYADQAEQLGLTVTAWNAIGDWSDGAENTIYSEISDAESYGDVERLAAMHGLASNQKAVIPFFAESEGPDAVYKITAPRGNSAELRKSLDEEGLRYRTIIVRRDSVQAVVFDKGSVMEASVNKFVNKCRARSERYKGRGDFLGGDTRIEGRAAYRAVLKCARLSDRGSRTGATVTRLVGFAGPVLFSDN